MYSVWGYYRHLFRRSLLSWRMLSVALLTILTMDVFLAGLRDYCHDAGVRLSQWGFAFLWINKYVVLSFLLIYIFAVSNFPLDRERERYSIARMGVSRWVAAQGLYLITFGWIYTALLLVLQGMLLSGVTQWADGWGEGWAMVSGGVGGYDMYVSVPYQVLSNYAPLEANLLVTVILGLLLGMLAILVLWMNLYFRAAGAIAGGAVIFLGLAADKLGGLLQYSPTSWIQLGYHYNVMKPWQPKPGYIVTLLVLLTVLELIMAKLRVEHTQENNRRR